MKTWAEKALAMLRAAGDRNVARQSRRFFKSNENVAFLGVRTPEVRQIEKQIHAAVKSAWSCEDALCFTEVIIRSRYLEAKAVGLLLLSRHAHRFDEALLCRAHGWLAGGHCSNWATTDVLSTLVIAPLLVRYPHLLNTLEGWTKSDCMWVRRSAAVSLTPLARRGKHLDEAYAVAAALLDNPEDLMHKAVGWLLRECGKTDDRRLEAFLLDQGPSLPRTALRYAVERFDKPRRKRILESTRSS